MQVQSWRRQVYMLQVLHLCLWHLTWFIIGRPSIYNYRWRSLYQRIMIWCLLSSKNLQPLDVLACNSANKTSYQNSTKGLFALCSIDVKVSLHFLHLWSIGQKGFLLDCEKMVYWQNYRAKCPEVAIFASFLWGNLKSVMILLEP